MRRTVSGLLVLGMVVASAPVRAEESAPCAPTASPPSASEARADERLFEAAMRRFQKLWQLTQSLVAERERRAFEEATAHYERFSALTRELSLKQAADEEQAFDESVALYLRKRDVTQALMHERSASSR